MNTPAERHIATLTAAAARIAQAPTPFPCDDAADLSQRIQAIAGPGSNEAICKRLHDLATAKHRVPTPVWQAALQDAARHIAALDAARGAV